MFSNPSLGYHGLWFQPADPSVRVVRREYGFVVVPPPPDPVRREESPFGIVHARLDDSYLAGGWIKTLTALQAWNETSERLDAERWRSLIRQRRQRGLLELPLVADPTWRTDATRPVSPEQLERLYQKMRQFFQADPSVRYWELGLEENLGLRRNRERWTHYWPNLTAKFRAVRRAAEAAGVSVRLIYQIEGFDYQTVEDLCASEVVSEIDVLSLHPYRWPDFPDPETWLPEHVQRVRAILRANGRERPLWFTEIGAPHHGNPDGFFGYPEKGARVQGKTRAEAAVYLVKCHVLAFANGVEKVFWYNYRDRGERPEHAEDHFGLVDYWGFPKPAYAAYLTLRRLLGERRFSRRFQRSGVWGFLFADADGATWVLWAIAPHEAVKVSLGALIEAGEAASAQAFDVVGDAVPIRDGVVSVGATPMYVVVGAP